jgi:membrane protein
MRARARPFREGPVDTPLPPLHMTRASHLAVDPVPRFRALAPVRALATEWSRVDGVHLASSLAFYAVLSLTPFLLVVVAITGWLLGSDRATHVLLDQVANVAGARTAAFIGGLVDGARPEASQQGARAVVGIFVTVLGATATFAELKHGLDRIFGTRYRAAIALVRTRLLAFLLLIGVALLAIASLLLSTAMTALLGDAAHADLPQAALTAFANELVTFLVLAVAFGGLLRVLPECPPRPRAAWTGALVAALLFSIGKFVIGWYLAHYALSSAYGAAGAIVVVMLWIYWSSALFFVGAVVAHLADLRAGRMADVAARADPPLHPAPETPA